MMFCIYKSKDGQYYFTIESRGNYKVVATSEMYVLKESAKKTIESIKKGIKEDSPVTDLTY